MSGIFSVAARMKHILSTPANPPAGQSLLYFKGDALPYVKTPAGNEHPLVENVVIAPPVDSPVLTAIGSNVAITLVCEGLVAPSTVLNYYMDGVLIAATRSMVYVVTQETDGDPLNPDVMYDFHVVASNQFGNGPASATITTTLNLAIDTDQIMAIVSAGFVLAGEIQVGNITINPDTGIVIPLASGGEIRFPADGSPAIIDAILRTNDLAVQGGLSINGVTNYINGKVWLASGVGNPQGLLGMDEYYFRITRRFPAVVDAGSGVYGLARTTDNTKWGTVLTLPTGNEKKFIVIDDTSGTVTASLHSDTAVNDFRSVAWCNGYFFVLGQRYNSSKGHNESYISKVSTTGVIASGHYPLDSGGNRLQPSNSTDGAIATDPSGNYVWVGRTQSNGRMRFLRYSVSVAGAFTNDPNSDVVTPVDVRYGQILKSLYVGNADFGSWRFVAGTWGEADGHWVRVFNLDGTYNATDSFTTGYYPTGLYWDTATGKFVHPHRDPTSYYHAEYSTEKTDRTVYGQYTWYDTNVSGGNKESAASPINNRLIHKRWFPVVNVPAPPKSGTGEDDPNAVNIYLDTDTTTRLLTTVTTGASATMTVSTLSGNATHPGTGLVGPPPPVGSTFPASSATGELASATGVDYFRGTGAYHFGGISGTGDGRTVADPLKVTGFQPIGAVIMYAGVAEPAGWLFCDGRAVSRTGTYAALFAAIGTTFGAGDGSTFNLPDVQRRFPWGVDRLGGTAVVLGYNEGQAVMSQRTSSHTHTIDGQTAGTTYDTGTGGQTVPRQAAYSGHSHGGATGGGGSPSSPSGQPNLALNFIIRYV